ncbi:MAG: DUF551 domain-containing protein [Negativibacillus sp.]
MSNYCKTCIHNEVCGLTHCDQSIACCDFVSGWISVKDRLPDPGSIVLIHQLYSWENNEDGAEITIGRLFPTQKGEKPYWEFQHYRPDFCNRSIMDNDIICPGSEYVTHWMPLPEPPKEA